MVDIPLMWIRQCHKPPMTGNGKHTTYKHGDLEDGLWHCFHHVNEIGGSQPAIDKHRDGIS